MIGRRRRTISAHVVAAALAAAVVAGSTEAAAYCRSTTCRPKSEDCKRDADDCPAEGEKLAWPTACLSFAVNRNGTRQLALDDTRKSIAKAFATWSDVECPKGGKASMRFEDRGEVACKKVEFNKDGPNLNVVMFQDGEWKYRGVDGTLAKTTVTYDNDTGEIFDADIEVNTADNTMSITDDGKKIQYDLQAIMTHEVGHFIGLAHSPRPEAVMYASYSPGTTGQRTLHKDDIAALCGIYAPGADLPCESKPKNGFTSVCSTPEEKGVCSLTPNSGTSSSSVVLLVGSVVLLLGVRRATATARRHHER